MEDYHLMVDTELEAKIRSLIEEVYCCICTIKIKAKYVDGVYMVYLYILNNDIDPLHILYESPSLEDFLLFLKLDLKERRLTRSSFVKINLTHDL